MHHCQRLKAFLAEERTRHTVEDAIGAGRSHGASTELTAEGSLIDKWRS
jgi:hypothetical protein